MEAAILAVLNADAKDRVHTGTILLDELRNSGELDGPNAGSLLSTLNEWLKSSNFKIASVGIECVSMVIDLAPESSAPFVPDLATTIREKCFSDSKEQVRDSALELCLGLMSITMPQEVWDVMAGGLKHRAPRVKEYSLRCFEQAITKFGQASLRIGPHVETLGKMVGDRDENVREAAVNALVEVFRHVGNRVRRDLARLDGLAAAKLAMLNERFDEVQASGTMIKTDDHPSSASSTGSSRRSIPHSRGISAAGSRKSPSVGVSPEEFTEAMDSGSATPAYAGSESALEHEFAEFRKLLADDRADWERRVAACRRIRCLMAGDATSFSGFNQLVFDSAGSLVAGVKDLRSQVSKEACITVAKFSEELGAKFEPTSKSVIPALFAQCIINTKVLADSAVLALENIVRTCHSHRMFAQVFDARSHKAVAMRKAAYHALRIVLKEWEPDVTKKVLSSVSEMVLVGQSDADSIVRQIARSSYWVLESIFPTAAANIMGKLDQGKIKILNKERNNEPTTVPAMKSSSRRISRKPSTPEPFIGEEERRSPSRNSLNSSGPLRIKASSTLSRDSSSGSTGSSGSVKIEGPQRVRPGASRPDSGMGTNADLNRSGPRRVGVSSAQSNTTKSTPSSAGSARRVVKQPLRVREPSVAEQLTSATRLSKSGNPDSRLDACTSVHELLSAKKIGESEAGKVSQLIITMLSDNSPKVVAAASDLLSDFMLRFRDLQIKEWIRGWTICLISKQSDDIPVLVKEKVVYAFKYLRGSYDTALQMLALFETLANHSEMQTLPAKLVAMEHMEQLLPQYTSTAFQEAYSSNAPDCLQGIQRMAEFVNVTSPELRRLVSNNLLSLFRVDPPMFSEMLSRWPTNSMKLVRRALDIALPSWESELRNSRNSRLSQPASSTEAFDLAVSMDDIGMGLDDDLLEPDDPSDALGYNPDMYSSPDHGSSTTTQLPDAVEPKNNPITNGRMEHTVDVHGPEEEERSELELAVESAIASYANGARDNAMMLATLQIFHQAAKEGGPVWDVHLDAVLEIILDLMDYEASAQVRDDALRNLRQMLKTQIEYLDGSIDVIVRKLLERHRESEQDILRSAEETLSVLSNVVPATTCALILMPIICNEDGAVLLAAIKLMTKILKKLSPNELTPLVDEIIPGLIQGYRHPLAEVRKGVVFALVEMHLVLGDALDPHLADLSSSQKKLLGIYIKRAEVCRVEAFATLNSQELLA